MSDAEYLDLLPNWWSSEWAKGLLQKFSTEELNQGRRLLTDRFYYVVNAAGKGPVYCYGHWMTAKLRSVRYLPVDKVIVRRIILGDKDGCDDLRRGVMNQGLWKKLSLRKPAPALTLNDSISPSGSYLKPDRAVQEAAALLYAAWMVSCDPALIFAWRGLSLYDDLSIPRLPIKPLPTGEVPVADLRLPGPERPVPAPAKSGPASGNPDPASGSTGTASAGPLPASGKNAAASSDVAPAAPKPLPSDAEKSRAEKERSEVIGRWAAEPRVKGWLSDILPPDADLRSAEKIAPRLHGFLAERVYGGVKLTATAELPGHVKKGVMLFFASQSYGTSRLRSYFRNHEEDCLALDRGSFSRELSDTTERIFPGFSDGSRDRLKESADPASVALLLRAAQAMSKYPRLMFLFRGVNIPAVAEEIRGAREERQGTGYGGARRRRSGLDLFDDTPYPQKSREGRGSGAFIPLSADLKAPSGDGAAAPDETGSAPWAEGWLKKTGRLSDDGVTGDARAILREGRASDFSYDPKKGRVICDITDEFGDTCRVSLSFASYTLKEQSIITALLCLNPKLLGELRSGIISSELRKLFAKYSLSLLPDGSEGVSVSRGGREQTCILAMLIRATQLLTENPALLISWRGVDISDDSLFEQRNQKADPLLEICAPGVLPNGFIRLFAGNIADAPLAEALKLLSGKTIGAPKADGKGSVSVSVGRLKGKKTAVLTLLPFTCSEAGDLARSLDRNYSLLKKLAEGSYPAELDTLLTGIGAELRGGTLTLDGQDVTSEIPSDPKLLAVIISLARLIGQKPGLLFAWRGLPLLRVPLGEILAEAAGLPGDAPFSIDAPSRTDAYLEKSFTSRASETSDGTPWWAEAFLESAEQRGYCSGRVDYDEGEDGDEEKMHFLPNMCLFYCDVHYGVGTKRLFLNLYELTDHGKKVILDFFRERPGLIKALGMGYLDRSYREFAAARNIPLLEVSWDEYLVGSDDGYCSRDERLLFVRGMVRLLRKDPSFIFLSRGLDIKKELGLSSVPVLQEPDEEQLREFAAADQALRRGKGAPADGAAESFLPVAFARRFIVSLADDAIIGYQRDAKASRIGEAEFDSGEHNMEIRVRHGTTSYDTASLYLEPLTDEEQQTVLKELREDPHALSMLQVGKLDEAFVRRLQGLGVPLMCGDSNQDRLWCSCDNSANRVCRHEIALLRRTARRLMSDPLLLFTMRGFDLSSELKELGAGKGASGSWMAPAALLRLHPELDQKDGEMTAEDALYHLNRASYAKVPAGLFRSASRLLSESPAGYGGSDCRGALLKALDSARECAIGMVRSDTEILSLPDFRKGSAEISADGRIQDSGNPPASARFTARRDDADPLSGGFVARELRTDWSGLQNMKAEKAFAEYEGQAFVPTFGGYRFEEMHSLPSGVFNGKVSAELLDRAGTAAQAMYALCSLARKLVLSDAIMPCPLRAEDGTLSVIWIPCLLSHEVLTLTARAGMLARRLLLGSVLLPDEALGIKAEEMSDAGFGALALGMFISDLVRKGFLLFMGHVQASWSRAERETPELLLLTLSYWKYSGIGSIASERVESSLGQWLAPLFIGLTGMRPVLILGTSIGPDLSIPDAEERLRSGGEQAIADAEKAEDEKSKEQDEAQEDASLGDDVSAEITMGFIDRSDGRYVSFADVPVLDAGKRGECRAAAARIASLLPEASDIVSGKSDRAVLSLDALQKALFEILPALKLSGALVVLPRSLRQILRPAAVADMGLQKGYREGSGLMSLASLLSFNWRATLGGRQITDEEFAELQRHAGHLVRFGNDFVYASASEIDAILKRLSGKTQRPSRLRLLEAALSGTYEGSEVFMDDEIRKAVQEELKTPPAKVPDGLNATLRPYQERGYSWLMHNLRARMGSIIADDMGLGKTVQVIAALEALRAAGELEKRQALIAVPASVVINWTRELRRFAPEMTVNVYYGTGRSLEPQTHVLLTTYGTLRQDIEKLKDKKWRVAIADEAQNIKNPGSQIFQDMCLLQTDSSIAMSGTPVENRLADYWAIMEFVNPGLFGTLGSFISDYAQPIERSRDADAVKRLRSVTAPFILRRLKTDKSVIADLPDKISSDRFCELTPEQAAMYQSFVSNGLEGVTETLSQMERSAMVLKLILRLKQICDAPELFSKDPKITGPSHSGKAEMLLDLLRELAESGQKAIVFTQFREMGELLVSWIGERLGTEPDFIHGGVSVKKRQEMVDRFQNDPENRVMVLSLKAAGTGLNLTAASAVIHYDLWWNPAVEDQATDRAYRIGQNKNVMVYRFICAGTFEEKINEMINSKKEIAELTVQKGERWLGDLSKSELRSFLSMTSG